MSKIADEQRTRSLYLTDETNVYFIPQGWADYFSFANGNTGGLDFDPTNDDHTLVADGPEVYCYAPTHTLPNSAVETLFVTVSTLEQLREVSEDEARRIHPELFATLSRINAGQE